MSKLFLDANLAIYLNTITGDQRTRIDRFFKGLLRDRLFTNMLLVDETLYVSMNRYAVPYALTLPRLKFVGFSSHSRRLLGSHTAGVLGTANRPPVSWREAMSPFRISLSEATRLRANTPIRSEEPSSYLMYEGQFIPRLKIVGFLAALSVTMRFLRRAFLPHMEVIPIAEEDVQATERYLTGVLHQAF